MPFDNVKTRMQSIGGPPMRMMKVASQMLGSEGLLVFWRATTPRLVRLTVSLVDTKPSQLELRLTIDSAVE